MASQKWWIIFIFLLYVLAVAGVALAQNGCHVNERVPGTKCLQPLKQIFDEIKPFILPGDRVDEFCNKWNASIACLKSLKKQCEIPIESMVRRSDNLQRLCGNDQNYRKEYLKNVGCVQKTANICLKLMMSSAGGTSGDDAGKARRERDENCKNIDYFSKCSKIQANQCDEDAASFVALFWTNELRFKKCNGGSHSAHICSSWTIAALSFLAMFSCKHLL